MIRRIARELAVQSLFQTEFTDCSNEDALMAAFEEHSEKNAERALPYARTLLDGIGSRRAEIDERIAKHAIGWTLERMPSMDRNILRLAIFEIFYGEEKIDAAIVINEAVELAKIYGTDATPKFINGVLGKMVKLDHELFSGH